MTPEPEATPEPPDDAADWTDAQQAATVEPTGNGLSTEDAAHPQPDNPEPGRWP